MPLLPCRARRTVEQRASAKSAAMKQLKHTQHKGLRIQTGQRSKPVTVGAGRNGARGGASAGTQQSQAPKPKKAAQAQQQPGKRKLGSKRGRLVEAQWGDRRGQYFG